MDDDEVREAIERGADWMSHLVSLSVGFILLVTVAIALIFGYDEDRGAPSSPPKDPQTKTERAFEELKQRVLENADE